MKNRNGIIKSNIKIKKSKSGLFNVMIKNEGSIFEKQHILFNGDDKEEYYENK